VGNDPQRRHLQIETEDVFNANIDEGIVLWKSLRSLAEELQRAATLCISCLDNGHKLLVCGNGGSASEAQHLAAELVGRYKHNRRGLAAVSLNSDSTVLTCIANDFSYDHVFARQVQALGRPGDMLVAFSTSGQARNVIAALKAARISNVSSIAFLGGNGGAARSLADCTLIVPHSSTARIQECHQFLMHSLMDIIETQFSDPSMLLEAER
jgi:D-sedoheptulose 7-phosphate isomerase